MFGFAWNINLWHVKFIQLMLSKNKYNINCHWWFFVFYFYYGDHVKNQKNSSFFTFLGDA